MTNIQIQTANAAQVDADPTANLAGASAGDIVFNSTTGQVECNDGTNWKQVGVTVNADPATNLTSAVIGDLAYDSTDNELQIYNGTAWVSVGGGGGGATYPQVLYTEVINNATANQNLLITHNLGLAQADVDAGKYSAFVSGPATNTFNYITGWGSTDSGTSFELNRWDAGFPGAQNQFTFQTNELRMKTVGGPNTANATLAIVQLFA